MSGVRDSRGDQNTTRGSFEPSGRSGIDVEDGGVMGALGRLGPFGETLSFYRLPRAHHKHLKSTNMLERLNEEIRRRTRVVRIFSNTLPAID
jgi:hypothetical protein